MKRTRPILSMLAASLACSPYALAQCPPQRLEPSDSGDRYGSAMAMNGDHLIVGDLYDTSLCTVRPDCSNGKVYAYQRDASGQWVFTQDVAPAALAPYFGYGASIDLDGDRLIVGAPGPGAGDGLGAAYVFEYDGEQWNETAELLGVRDPPYTGVGVQVAIGGDIALVAAYGGIVFQFHHVGTRWEMVDMLRNPDSPDVRSDFGRAIDIDGQRVAIGAYLEEVIAPSGGAVYMYLRQPGGRLELEQKLLAPDVLSSPRFGSSVSLDGEQLAIGGEIARRTHSSQGVVYMHEYADGRWELSQELVADDAGERDRFSRGLHLLGDRLAVGAPTKQPSPDRAGTVYLFERGSGDQWIQVESFAAEPSIKQLGFRVALSDEYLAAAAPETPGPGGEGRGSAHVYDLSCVACPPDLDADGTLTIFDFLTFLNLFQDGDAQADFDGDGELTIFDFLAFQTAFDAGCE